MSRTIAVTTLLEGQIEIGEMVTISTTLGGTPGRQTYRGQIFDISTWPDGCEYAAIAVLGMRSPIHVRLEQQP